MDFYTLIPRTLLGVFYPAFASLRAVLLESPGTSVSWMKYWVVLGVFSVIELLLDLVLNPLPYSFPTYLVLKCTFLVWCMAPIDMNGSDVIFNNVSINIQFDIFSINPSI
jgi:receptor expression-enhancing protein 5/6